MEAGYKLAFHKFFRTLHWQEPPDDPDDEDEEDYGFLKRQPEPAKFLCGRPFNAAYSPQVGKVSGDRQVCGQCLASLQGWWALKP